MGTGASVPPLSMEVMDEEEAQQYAGPLWDKSVFNAHAKQHSIELPVDDDSGANADGDNRKSRRILWWSRFSFSFRFRFWFCLSVCLVFLPVYLYACVSVSVSHSLS